MDWKFLRSIAIIAVLSSFMTLIAVSQFGGKLDGSFENINEPIALPSPAPIPTSRPLIVDAITEPVGMPDPSDLMPCAVVQDVVSIRDCQYYTMAWNTLATGDAAFEIDEEMTRDQEYPVSFVIKGENSASDFEELLGERPEQTFRIKVGGAMAAELSGTGFKIDPTERVSKALGPGSSQKWNWKVIPVRNTKHELILEAYIIVRPPDGEGRETLIRTFKRDVAVQVTNGQRLSDIVSDTQGWLADGTNLMKALGAFLTAAIAVFAILRGRKKKAEKAA